LPDIVHDFPIDAARSHVASDPDIPALNEVVARSAVATRGMLSVLAPTVIRPAA